MTEQTQLFEFVEYSPVLAFCCKMLTVNTTFLWTFMDLILILLSLGLSTQFRKINESLMRHKGKVFLTSTCTV